MASIGGAAFSITGASGSTGLLGPKQSWRAYILPRGGHASAASTGTLITFDSAAVASRFAANNWIQVGLNTANIRQVAAVGGNSLSVSGAAVTVAENDRVFLIGNTQPTVSGGSATYTVPATTIRQRDDDAADLFTNSMVTSNADGLIQFWSEAAAYDAIIQDSNQGNQGSIIDMTVGAVEGISTAVAVIFGATVTITGNVIGNTIYCDTLRSALEPVYNVRHTDYGAVGDGSTNDTTAVQAAINAIPSTGGVLFFPGPRTYLLGALTGKSNLTIEGNGSTIKCGADGVFDFTSDTNVRIRNCRFDGQALYRRLIIVEKATDVQISKCRFTNVLAAPNNGDDYTVIAASASDQVTVSECEFVDTNATHIVVLGKSGVADGTDVGATDFHFVNNRMNAIGNSGSNGLGVYANPDASSCKRVVFSGNIYQTGVKPIQLNGVDGCVISNNISQAVANGPVVASFNAASRSTDIAITGNVVVDCQDEAIAVVDGDGVEISGNQVSLCEFGISVQGCIDTQIASNVCRDVILGSNKLGIEVKPSTLNTSYYNVAVTGNQVLNFGAVGIRVVGIGSSITVSSNTIAGSSTANATGLELSTASGALTSVHVVGNNIHTVDEGIEARSWTGGSLLANSVKTTGVGRACLIQSLDGQTTGGLVVANNYFDGAGAAQGLRIVGVSGGTSQCHVMHNTIRGDGTNSFDLRQIGDSRIIGNVQIVRTEVPVTTEDNALFVSPMPGYQGVSSTPANLVGDVGVVYAQAGSSQVNLTKAFGGKIIEIRNYSGITLTIAGDTAGPHTILSGATTSLGNAKHAVYRFRFTTLNWELLSGVTT